MPKPLPPGTKIANSQYTVDKPIGKGGFSMVYCANDNAGQLFAIKEVFDTSRCYRGGNGKDITPKDNVSHAEVIHKRQCRRAKEEYERFKGINHPNLMVPIDVAYANNTVYLILPLLDAPDLDEIAVEPIELDKAVELIKPVCGAVNLLHRLGVIHRDLKPDNIKLVNKFGQWTPVLMDTGAARSFEEEVKFVTGIFTPYTAPEIFSEQEAKKFGQPGPWSDTFELTGIFYYLISCEHPLDYINRVNEIEIKKHPDPLKRPEKITDRTWKFIQTGLSLQTSKRYQNITEFADALHELVFNSDRNDHDVITENHNENQNLKTSNTQQNSTVIWGLAIMIMLVLSMMISLVANELVALLFLVINSLIGVLHRLMGKESTANALIPLYNIYLFIRNRNN